MNYRHDNEKNVRMKKRLLGVFGIAIILFVIFSTKVGTVINTGIESVATPLFKVSGQSGTSLFANLVGTFLSKSALSRENDELKKELHNLGLKLLDRNLLQEENVFLKESLGRPYVDERIFARVLARPGQSIYDTLVIDLGRKNGLRGGERVLYNDTIFIGSIVEVNEKTAKVKLLSSFGEEVNVMIGNSSVPAIARGYGGGNFEIKVPREISVSLGDIISAPAIMQSVLGTVEFIESKPNDPFERVLFRSPVSLNTLTNVSVLLGY